MVRHAPQQTPEGAHGRHLSSLGTIAAVRREAHPFGAPVG